MTNYILPMLYFVFAGVLGSLSVVLKKKHTSFPDFRVGYHNKKIMENKEKWDYANNTSGNLCALFAAGSIFVSAILYLLKAKISTTIIIFDYKVTITNLQSAPLFGSARGRVGSFGINQDYSYEYKIYVHKKDFEQAAYLLQKLRESTKE